MRHRPPNSAGPRGPGNLPDRDRSPGARGRRAGRRALRAWLAMLPVLLGVLLLMSLLVQLLPSLLEAGLFGTHPLLDALLGTGLGSIAAGQPVVSYLLSGELSAAGVSRVGVTALVVAWVTVGLSHLPLEAQVFGWRFALLRNLLGFFLALLIAFLMSGLSGGF
jgi:hypothetical protein